MKILIKGAGDLATGIASRLYNSGYQILMTDIAVPLTVRRTVALSRAVYEGKAEVETMTGILVKNMDEAEKVLSDRNIPVIVDEKAEIRKDYQPDVVVDAILAKKNLGTSRMMADKTIALGPGFSAGKDVDLVVETQRGHNLGRIIKEGPAAPNTGTPGIIGGYGKERVIHSPAEGKLYGRVKIGDKVEKGQTIAVICTENGEEVKVEATLTGLVRGLIRDAYPVTVGFKIADIDPRESEYKNCFTISDKARNIGGSVLEGLMYLEEKQGY